MLWHRTDISISYQFLQYQDHKLRWFSYNTIIECSQSLLGGPESKTRTYLLKTGAGNLILTLLTTGWFYSWMASQQIFPFRFWRKPEVQNPNYLTYNSGAVIISPALHINWAGKHAHLEKSTTVHTLGVTKPAPVCPPGQHVTPAAPPPSKKQPEQAWSATCYSSNLETHVYFLVLNMLNWTVNDWYLPGCQLTVQVLQQLRCSYCPNVKAK